MDLEEVSVVKSGEKCITINLDRSELGICVHVHALPRVEEFMRALGTGEKVDALGIGRYWAPVDGEDRLLAYVTQPLPELRTTGINMEALGNLLLRDVDERGRVLAKPEVNISFLRLVGISDPMGVKFGLKSPISTGGLRKLRDQIGEAARRFYLDYLRPIDVAVIVSTQEISR